MIATMDNMGGMRLPTGKDLERFVSKIDTSGDCWNWTAGKFSTGYGAFKLHGRQVLAHRLAFELFGGVAIPDGLQVDHTCHNRACVRRAHLRIVTPRQNSENRQGANRDSKSGVRGVFWHDGKWHARFMAGGERIYVGKFDTLEAAADAISSSRNLHHTHNDKDRND